MNLNNVINIIDWETLTAATDILLNLPAAQKHKALKDCIIEEFSKSAMQQIKLLVSEIQFRNDKLFHLLQKMKELAYNVLNNNLLKNIMALMFTFG